MPKHVNLGSIFPSERDLRGEVEAFGGKILARLARSFLLPPAPNLRPQRRLTNPRHSPPFVLSSLVYILRGIGIAVYSHSLYVLFNLCCDRRLLIPGYSATFA